MRLKRFGIFERKAQRVGGRKFVQRLSSHEFESTKYINVLKVRLLLFDLDIRKIRFKFSLNL